MVDFEQIYSISKEIYEIVQQAKENQKECEGLRGRVSALEKVVRTLEGHDRDEGTEATLVRMLDQLSKCLTFVREFSKSRNTVMKLVKAKDYQKELTELKDALTTGALDLSTALLTAQSTAISKKRGSIFIKPTDKKENQEERTAYILERLEKLFVEERQWNEKTDNCDTYNRCLQEVRPGLELHYKYGKSNVHVLKLKGTELTDPQSKDELHKMVALAQSKIFLRLVAEGEQDEAETMLKSNPALALVSTEVTDLSKRTFKNITALQYALWALDWHMWTMLLKYIPQKDAAEQIAQLEQGLWVPQHGVTANWENLTQALNQYVSEVCANKPSSVCGQIWVKQVGGAQLLLPAHVINEYCHPTRPFDPVPDFSKPEPVGGWRGGATDKGEWFSAKVGGGTLGEGFAVCRGTDRRCVRTAMNTWYFSVFAERDFKAVAALFKTRASQRAALVVQYLPKPEAARRVAPGLSAGSSSQ